MTRLVNGLLNSSLQHTQGGIITATQMRPGSGPNAEVRQNHRLVWYLRHPCRQAPLRGSAAVKAFIGIMTQSLLTLQIL